MNILIAGATGLIGQRLLPVLLDQGHHITVLTRNKTKAGSHLELENHNIVITDYKSGWNSNIDVVINLAGSPVTRSWTRKQRARIVNSRLLSTDYIYIRCLQNKIKPKLWLTISATGYYHDDKGRVLDESSVCVDGGFLFRTCEKIEKNSQKVANIVERHCILRIGLVMDKKHGFLSKLLPLYRKHLGGRIGNGRQYLPWIHISDVIGAIDFIIRNQGCRGIYNLSAPEPCRQKDFSKVLSKALGKANPLVIPKFAVRLFLRQQNELLLNNQNVIPARLLEAGYVFRYPHLDQAISDLVSAGDPESQL